MVGNKQDNRYGGPNLEKMLKEYPDELKFMKSVPPDSQFFSSAMTNYNVNKVFKKVCEKIYEDRDVVKVLERKEKKEDRLEKVEKKEVRETKGRREKEVEDSFHVVGRVNSQRKIVSLKGRLTMR